MANADDIKAAEQRGYSRGYSAGKRRLQREVTYDQRQRERQEFLDRAFLAILPAAMNAQGWKFGENLVTSTEDRVRLAVDWARQALSQRPIP